MYSQSQTIWNQNHTKAFSLVEKLYNPETKKRSALIRSILNDPNSTEILVEAQKILDYDFRTINEEIDCSIDQAIAVKSPFYAPIPKQKMILILNEINTKDNIYLLAKKYQQLNGRKKIIEDAVKDISEELTNQEIENSFSIFKTAKRYKYGY